MVKGDSVISEKKEKIKKEVVRLFCEARVLEAVISTLPQSCTQRIVGCTSKKLSATMDKSMLGDLDALPEEDKLRMTSMIDQLQIRDR